MSGIQSRKMYDDCYQNVQIQQSTGPGNYRVHSNSNANQSCNVQNGINNFRNTWYAPGVVQNLGLLVDIESHLKNIDLPDSYCPNGRTLLEKNKYMQSLSAKAIPSGSNDCNRNLEQIPTRLVHPVSDIRGSTQSRFDFPIVDPRSFAYFGMGTGSDQNGSSRFGVNSRLTTKDMKPADFAKKMEHYKEYGI